MRVSEIKKGVYGAFVSFKVEDKVDEQILSCLLYDLVKRVLALEDSQQNDVSSLAGSYLPGLAKKLEEFKVSFISYSSMRAEVESFGNSTFLAYTSSQIARIAALYQDRTKILPFSSVYFSQYMYKLTNVGERDYKRLSRVHSNLMGPIARFYADKNRGSDSDLEVFTALGYSERPGKEILFTVKGVDPSRVVADVRTARMPVYTPRDYQEIRVKGKYVMIVTA
jgi:hypothetical protein